MVTFLERSQPSFTVVINARRATKPEKIGEGHIEAGWAKLTKQRRALWSKMLCNRS